MEARETVKIITSGTK